MAEKLTPAELNDAIADLDGWAKTDGPAAIEQTHKISDLRAALASFTRGAATAPWEGADAGPGNADGDPPAAR